MPFVSEKGTGSGGGGGAVDTRLEKPLRVDIVNPETDTPTRYCGFAAPGSLDSSAVWAISKADIVLSGGDTTTTWANGAQTFVNIWDNRTGLSYS